MRLDDVPEPGRTRLAGLACPTFDDTPWVVPKPAAQRRVAMISTAGLARRGDAAFDLEATDYRVIPGDVAAGDLAMSHVSSNFDRAGFQQDMNVVFPIDRLRERAEAGEIGSVADYHYSVMGFTAPEKLAPAARELAGLLKADGVDTVLLFPV